ncbi:HAMP domain-containing sensor histidine kinase [Glycomyces sp. NPDC046736]|uniref:sensor histidine kinase n=1 Tax=Glycomyces sp. NPDC046736 TaxID=3155615 RepID=UPI003408B47F
MARPPGLSVRLKLTLSYAGFLMVAGVLLLGAVWRFLLHYIPEEGANAIAGRCPESFDDSCGWQFMPGRDDLVRAFGPKAAILLAFLLLFGLVGGWFLAGRMLAPLNRITAATRLAAGGSLTHRVRLRGKQDEFRELADAFDAMLARLEAHVAEQRRFAANASHELRTPLAITQAMLDVARNDPRYGRDQLVERLYAVNARAVELTEALLLLSRADGGSFTRETVDLSLLAEEAAETLVPLAEERGVAVETSGTMAAAAGSRALLLQLITNLVHNAIVHNLPSRGVVRVATWYHNGLVALAVENTGPRVDPDQVATLLEPFKRGAERTRSLHGGQGLGLAIVHSIVRAHDGVLTLTPLTTGGLRVTVQLRAAVP